MSVLHSTGKGPLLNTLQNVYIYRETLKDNQLNDKNTVAPNSIFDTMLRHCGNNIPRFGTCWIRHPSTTPPPYLNQVSQRQNSLATATITTSGSVSLKNQRLAERRTKNQNNEKYAEAKLSNITVALTSRNFENNITDCKYPVPTQRRP
jgi:hypothetical protein